MNSIWRKIFNSCGGWWLNNLSRHNKQSTLWCWEVVHVKRSLNSRLYNLWDRFKGSKLIAYSVFSPKFINYLTKCFPQSVTASSKMFKILSLIKARPQKHYSSLPLVTTLVMMFHGVVMYIVYKIQQPTNIQICQMVKIFLEMALKKALTDILDEYSTDIVVNKLTPCANLH